ncbi:MAG TPA: NifB/NifX family molybdenum-iron cluster-binding protein [Chitinispirillaceae bacterium]|nr:NifB/NifX family molybdenum-iron cluster-binding protein [Chitinispirillaceae bacterium]
MKIAVTAENPQPESMVDPRFGRAKFFLVYDEDKKTWETIDNKQNLQSAQGAGIQSAANIVNAGCNILISGHCGPKAFTALKKAGVEVYTLTGGTVKNAVDSFKQGKLNKIDSADVEGHW